MSRDGGARAHFIDSCAVPTLLLWVQAPGSGLRLQKVYLPPFSCPGNQCLTCPSMDRPVIAFSGMLLSAFRPSDGHTAAEN